MTLDTIFHKGDPDKPLALFIHGMGMDSRIWADPADARVLGGKYPLSAVMNREGRELRTSFADFSGRGHSVLTWSQRRPAGPIAFAVRELEEIITTYHEDCRRPLVIIAHSRGGLVARKFLQFRQDLRGVLITIATPHHGSSMARFGAALSPFASMISTLLGDRGDAPPSTPFRRILAFLQGKGLRELLPDSPFFSGLTDKKGEGLRYFSMGGTDPHIVTIRGIPAISVLTRALPGSLIPDEMKERRGDGLVTAKSARIPYADGHTDFPLNHLSLLFDPKVRETVLSMAR